MGRAASRRVGATGELVTHEFENHRIAPWEGLEADVDVILDLVADVAHALPAFVRTIDEADQTIDCAALSITQRFGADNRALVTLLRAHQTPPAQWPLGPEGIRRAEGSSALCDRPRPLVMSVGDTILFRFRILPTRPKALSFRGTKRSRAARSMK